MRSLTARLQLQFEDLGAEDHDAAREAVQQVVVAMQEHCRAELAAALETVGARMVKMDILVF